MDFITNIVAKFFGNKSEKDIEEIKPIVEQTNAVYATLSSLSNDQLRAKSDELRLKMHQQSELIEQMISMHAEK